MPTPRPEYYTPKDIAIILRLSIYTIWHWIEEGTNNLPVTKIGSKYRISKTNFDKWLAARTKG